MPHEQHGVFLGNKLFVQFIAEGVWNVQEILWKCMRTYRNTAKYVHLQVNQIKLFELEQFSKIQSHLY